MVVSFDPTLNPNFVAYFTLCRALEIVVGENLA
jgi:hypothetical protein